MFQSESLSRRDPAERNPFRSLLGSLCSLTRKRTMQLTIILSVCSLVFAETSQRQSGSLLPKADDATKNTARAEIDMAELLKSTRTRAGTLKEPEARKENVIKNSKILVNVEKLMTTVSDSVSRASVNNQNDLSNGQCGKVVTSDPSGRIIGGDNADVGEWPWQAMILLKTYSSTYFVCGGSLIGSQWVLSAAHCFDTRNRKNPSQTKIALGAQFQDLSGNNTKIFDVNAVLCHSEYNDYILKNDICLVKLASEVEYTNYISPICLPSSSVDNVFAGETCVITGWGETQGTGNSLILQEAYVEVFSRQNCTDWYAEDYVDIPDWRICAGTTDASKNACYGDSGGPLACSRSAGGVSFSTLFGITSFGSRGCLNPERPSVFTNVAYYLDWIEDTKINGVNVCYELSSIHSCGSVITANNSRIRSPIADNTTWFYPDDVDCSWIVQAPAGYVVKIEFICHFYLEYGCQDYLEIKSSNGREYQVCGYYSVRDLEPLVAESRTVNLTFHSNSYLTREGFVVQISFVEPEIYAGQCGVRSDNTYSPLIIGGSYTSIKEWPWQARVMFYNKNSGNYNNLCGGTLINNQWILSSARCFEKKDPALYTITLGDFSSMWSYRILAVGFIFCHEEYDSTTAENNICLVKLAVNVTPTSSVRQACIPDKDIQVENGKNCTITGYGVDGGYYSTLLHEAEVDIISRLDCTNWYKEDGITITEENFCAGGDNEYYYTTAPCEGDYGGPLVCKSDESSSFAVMGVANFAGVTCGKYNRPGVFTEVARFSDWINQTMSDSQDIGACFDSSTIRKCGTTISVDNTIIRSPVVDEESWQYPSDVDCVWNISAPVNKRIKIEFMCFFNVENKSPTTFCATDYLSIEETKRSARYCGLRKVDELDPYVTKENKVKLRFHSDYDSITLGFVLKVSFVTKDESILESIPEDGTSTAHRVAVANNDKFGSATTELTPEEETNTTPRVKKNKNTVSRSQQENNASASESTPGAVSGTIPRVAVTLPTVTTTSGAYKTPFSSFLGIIVASVLARFFV